MTLDPRRPILAIAGAALVGIALRLHFLSVPLTTDEGGYAAIARLWSDGHRLYGDVAWVDRPQGLVLLYRLAGLTDGTTGVRLLAIGAATVTLAAVAAGAWALAGARAAIAAAWLYALLSPAPHLEGFTANGELLAGALAACGVALILWWRRAPSSRLLVAATLAAGAAPMVKQSAFDGIVVVAVVVLATAPRAARTVALAAGGIVAPTLLALLHGLLTGPGDWWYAVVGYHTGTESLLSGDHARQLRLFEQSLRPLRDLYGLLAVALLGLTSRASPDRLLAGAWLSAVLVGVLGGGLFHAHYWIALLPPAAILAGSTVARGSRRTLAVAVVVTVASLGVAGRVYTTSSPRAISSLTSSDTRILDAPAVGHALEAASAPGSRVLALWANASVYWYADRVPASRYLWHRNLELIPGAVAGIVATIAGPDRPAAIAVYQPPRSLDPTGAVERALRDSYALAGTIAGVPVYRLRR